MFDPSSPPPATDRDLASALRVLAQFEAALRRDERARIVETARQLVALGAPLGRQWPALARIVADNGEIGLAREAMARFVEGAGGGPSTFYQMAALTAQLGLWDESVEVMRGLPADVPDKVSYAHGRGTAALHVGHVAEARHWLEEAVRLRPSSAPSWHSLATLVDFADEPALAERLIAAGREIERLAPRERGVYLYALGKVHADRREHAEAFAAFARGAADIASLGGYSRERDGGLAAEAVRGYDAERIAAIARSQSEPTGRAIFVTGLPRSGTTLVEHILASHSQVAGGAESNRLGLLLKDVRGVSGDDLARYVEATGAPEAARLWSHWLGERFPSPGRVVEKSTINTRLLGLAAALLPEAPLVWVRRDPLDCAWSCFRTYFLGNLPWSYELEDIAFHFRLEDELLARWQDVLGDRLLVVPYEALVTDPRAWIARLLAHCGLPEERQAFAPHETRRTVTTSSVMQVRRPIGQGSVGSAEPYRELLEPFVRAYGG